MTEKRPSSKKSKSQVTTERRQKPKMVNSMDIVADILNYRKLPQMAVNPSAKVRSFDSGSYTVLPSSKTRLIGCFINVSLARVFTVDIDCLVRQWDLTTGECSRSYPLEKPSQAGDQNSMDNNLVHFKSRHQI